MCDELSITEALNFKKQCKERGGVEEHIAIHKKGYVHHRKQNIKIISLHLMYQASVLGIVQGFDDVIALDDVVLYVESCDELTIRETQIGDPSQPSRNIYNR